MRTNKEIEEIYKRHMQTVYRLSFSFMKNIPDTEDAVQDTFIRLINYSGIFNGEEHEKAWLIVTCSNICRDKLKHWWRRNTSISDYQERLRVKPFEPDGTLEALLKLPNKYKTAVYLYYYERQTSAEIAAVIGKTESAVRNLLSEGRKILKKTLTEEIPE